MKTNSLPGRLVLKERLRLLDYALANYDDGVLFFYFSSTDLQSHMLWWDSDAKHPTRSPTEAKRCFGHVRRLYQKLDGVVGDILARYGDRATVIVMSDHGFANFGRQFNLNSWLRDEGYLGPRGARRCWPTWTGRGRGPTGWESTGCTSISRDASGTASSPPVRAAGELLTELVSPAGGRPGCRRATRDPPRVPLGPGLFGQRAAGPT